MFSAFTLGTLIGQSQHRLSGLKSSSLRLFTSIWLACILSVMVESVFRNITAVTAKNTFKKLSYKKVGYQSGVIGVLTVPLHPKPIGKT